MDDNTLLLAAILRQDWQAFDDLAAKFNRDRCGTPVALIGFAFFHAVRRFGPATDLQQIRTFIEQTRAFLSDPNDLPPCEAEAVICAALDMHAPWAGPVIDGLDIGAITRIEGYLLAKLIADKDLSDEELDAFLAEANRLAQDWPDGFTS